MEKIIDEFIRLRVDDVYRELSKRSVEFAMALHELERLQRELSPLLFCQTSLFITAGDCQALRECLEQETAVSAVLQQAMYRQGYLDCMELMRMLRAF